MASNGEELLAGDGTEEILRVKQGRIQKIFGDAIFFEMVIFPYRRHGCLGVRKLQVFNISDLIKTLWSQIYNSAI